MRTFPSLRMSPAHRTRACKCNGNTYVPGRGRGRYPPPRGTHGENSKMAKGNKSTDVITHLQHSWKTRQDEKAKMQRVQGKASSLGLNVCTEEHGPSEQPSLVRYALMDRQTK